MLESRSEKRVVLLAGDNPAERALAQRVLRQVVNCDLRVVSNGVQALQYLRRQARYADPEHSPRPDLILLDLDMPHKSGMDVLAELRNDPAADQYSVVMFTSTMREEDVIKCYALGCHSFINKPTQLTEFRAVLRLIASYWLNTVVLPHPNLRGLGARLN